VRGPAAAEAIARAVGETLTGLPPGRPDVVVAGLAGIGEHRHVGPPLAAAIAEQTGAHRVVVTGDLVTSYVGALGLEPGVVVAAGTGAVAFALGPDGRTGRADGWGYLLGDEGSGHWIGRAGLAAALASRDGLGGSPELRARAEARFGRVEDLPGLVHGSGSPGGVVAAFAPDVAAAAAAGDAVAAAIWVEAGCRLAAEAAAGQQVLGDGAGAVACTGGLMAAGELLLGPFREELARRAPQLVLRPAAGTALDGAEALADVDPLPPALGHEHLTAG
jgi:N-acetylglucosamine kinase-like BadF-type ATPase